jgi:predicted AlkP superfamily phosphohydrolase/phosphomutase
MQVKNAAKNSTKKSDRIVVIGLDSCDADLVQLWSKEGRLPYMSSLIKKGVWTRLLSTRGLFADAPWPSFNIGVSPAKHSFYKFLQLKRGTTEIIRVGAYEVRQLPFWSLFQNGGKKIAVFDVPKTYPVQGPNGIQVASWGEHYPLIQGCSLPTSMLQELNSRFGKYRHPYEVISPGTSKEMRLYEKMLTNIDQKAKATRFLMDQEDWDLFVSVFAEPHYGGHQLYHHYDPRHWAHDSQRAKLLADSLPTLYSRIDSALSALLSDISDEATLFIVSVHGISTNYSANHLMTSVLEKLGFQIPPANGHADISKKGGRFLHAFTQLAPWALRDFINERILPQSIQDRLLSRLFSSSIDWKRSKAFFLPSDHFQGFISLNLKGREPWGIVQPGSDYDQVCEEIRSELMRLVNPDTGNPAIQEVVQVSKIYHGENLWNLPDLVIRWSEDGYIRQLHHPKFGIISDQGFKLRKSQHTVDGFMIAAGKHINQEAVLNGATTMDLAPTILHLMGQPIPKDIDGRVLMELLNEKSTIAM